MTYFYQNSLMFALHITAWPAYCLTNRQPGMSHNRFAQRACRTKRPCKETVDFLGLLGLVGLVSKDVLPRFLVGRTVIARPTWRKPVLVLIAKQHAQPVAVVDHSQRPAKLDKHYLRRKLGDFSQRVLVVSCARHHKATRLVASRSGADQVVRPGIQRQAALKVDYMHAVLLDRVYQLAVATKCAARAGYTKRLVAHDFGDDVQVCLAEIQQALGTFGIVGQLLVAHLATLLNCRDGQLFFDNVGTQIVEH